MKLHRILSLTAVMALLVTVQTAWAQRGDIQYFRYYDQRGINVFET